LASAYHRVGANFLAADRLCVLLRYGKSAGAGVDDSTTRDNDLFSTVGRHRHRPIYAFDSMTFPRTSGPKVGRKVRFSLDHRATQQSVDVDQIANVAFLTRTNKKLRRRFDIR
jgi:hypothetical protein